MKLFWLNVYYFYIALLRYFVYLPILSHLSFSWFAYRTTCLQRVKKMRPPFQPPKPYDGCGTADDFELVPYSWYDARVPVIALLLVTLLITRVEVSLWYFGFKPDAPVSTYPYIVVDQVTYDLRMVYKSEREQYALHRHKLAHDFEYIESFLEVPYESSQPSEPVIRP